VIARPASLDGTEVAERVRDALTARTPLRIVAGGHWLDAGRPSTATTTLDVRPMSGVVEYEPGDLTLTIRAGTPLTELERVTRAEGQWLPLDPFGTPEGTLGATLATASAGPLASAYGTPRDHVLGCEFVTGTGDVVRAGGRVVKNVAGFDLVRLVVGAWGTLGVLTEITVRLRALPEVDRTLALDTDAGAAWRWLRASEFTPLAAELVSPSLARALGAGDDAALLVRIAGNEALVRSAAESIGAAGPARELDPSVWRRLGTSEPRAAAVIRLATVPSRVGALWQRVSAVIERVGGFAHATLARGVIRCVVPLDTEADEDNARLRGILGTLRIDATFVAERLPAPLWAALVPPAAADPLSVRVRNAFDPEHILNPGILGESS
jgi:glycolate oxidase FAD binding subunit